jgi:UDP-N-acetylmuramoyl-L-alanyl-D-glutamate--2,6-diaminopimelate ligase
MSRTVRALAEIVGGVVHGDPDVDVSDVTHDSREAGRGTLFVAVQGATFDGHDYVPDAVAAGCPAVCVTRPMRSGASEIVVEETRQAMGPISSLVHGNPSHDLDVIGVTGTNGKTTVTHYIDSIASANGLKSGLIGTVETRLGDVSFPTVRTTPEAPELQRLLRSMGEAGADLVNVEVSSHALDMERVSGTRFAVAAFTNLSRDHLDYHGTMEAYRSAKLRLFADYEVGTAVINIDDPVGAGIAHAHRGRVVRVGAGGDVAANEVETSLDGSTFQILTPYGAAAVFAPVVGRFNVDNLLIAIGSCLALGISLEATVDAAGRLDTVPGRFELVSGDSPVTVIVDYAHTPEGVGKAIGVAREATSGRVIALVGAGGDRDRDKRPLMGEAAARSDIPVITSDNPRSEDPESIIAEVILGVDGGGGGLIVEPDRRLAIEKAIGVAHPGDVVLILGKGHETGQEISGTLHPFDDRLEARRVLGLGASATDSPSASGSMSR